MYVMTPLIPLKTKSINLAKLAGDPCRPIGVTVHWYLIPLPGTVKLVTALLDSSRDCCQNPDVRSIVLDFARPISSIQSLISWIV